MTNSSTSSSETRAEQRRFYHEACPLMDELAQVGIPTLVHQLLEALEQFVPFDPRGVFLRVGRTLNSGKEGGYQYEPLGVSLFVRLVQRYLAEYRHVFREDDDCRKALLDALDEVAVVIFAVLDDLAILVGLPGFRPPNDTVPCTIVRSRAYLTDWRHLLKFAS